MPYFDYAIMGLLVLQGLVMIIANKPFFVGAEKYTDESLNNYARPAGVTTLLLGLTGLLTFYVMRLFFAQKVAGWVLIVCFVLVIVAIVANRVVAKKTLVKK